MKSTQNHHKNNLGLLGWLGGGRYGAERYAYTLHRLTGIGLLFYFLMHIIVTSSRILGPEAWDSAMHSFETPLFKFGEFLVFLAFAFHGINGIRLGLTELGYMMGKPARPVYPYKTAVTRQRPFFIVIMILAALVMILGGVDFYLL